MKNSKGEKLVWGVSGFKARTPKVLRNINLVGIILTAVLLHVLPNYPEIPASVRDLITRIVIDCGVLFNLICEQFGWAKTE